ncbi:Cystathionine beta-synthase [Plasmodiophora brassicae]|uniref:Cystathionine beta-synthase n=1 Tax=Plasmodiophora brassicae TaxID=37360 RepID=A0A3P3Y5Q5_PLABS|nr:unnamed protein product [Plasmodiophora brassicae]
MTRKPEWRFGKPGVLDNILGHIGGTPIVRLNKIGKADGVQCELLAKCEFFNAGGSIKDRIGLRMVEDAEKSGRIKPGDTLIEPTSGNTGIGLALAAAIKGYRMIITMPEKMSQEKVNILKALGAEIIRTPTEAAWDSPESHIGVAQRLQKEIENSHILDQYKNPSNPLAHYEGTAEEIYLQCQGQLDMIVVAAGTGGTIAGVSKRLKELLPNIIVVGVDPIGSILAQPESLNGPITSYQVEGIGYDFVPDVLDRSHIDFWVKTEDPASLRMARRLIREEGLLCGGSSGASTFAAVQAAKQLKPGQRCLVLLADSIRNYMSKHLSDDWMAEHDFLDADTLESNLKLSWWSEKRVSDLDLNTPMTALPTMTCKDAVQLMHDHGFDQLPVVNNENEVLGMITEGNLMSQLSSGRVRSSSPISDVIYRRFKQIKLDTKLRTLSKVFETHHFVLVVTTQKCASSHNKVAEKTVVFGVVTRIDLLNFIMGGIDGKGLSRSQSLVMERTP